MSRTRDLQLVIYVDESLWGHPIWTELQRKGHTVIREEDHGDYDLRIGPRCWRVIPSQLKWASLAIKEAQAARRGRKGVTA